MGMKETLSLVEEGSGTIIDHKRVSWKPWALLFYAPDGRELLSIRISVTFGSRVIKIKTYSETPVATVNGEIASILAKIYQ
jgi:hypothetical protein